MRQQEIFNQKVDLYKDNLNELVVEQVGFGKKILDIGCSGGRLGQYLKKHKKATVFGIDIASKAIKRAKKNLDKACLLNIETDTLPFAERSFDIIICADVLEHLYQPLLVLRKLKSYLKDSGVFIFSIPNVANIEVRWNLLWGRFDYQQIGIIDESHLRFFTKKTAIKLVSDAGLKVVKMDYSPGFSFFFLQGRIMKLKLLRKLQYRLAKLAPKLFCAQFIIVAKP